MKFLLQCRAQPPSVDLTGGILGHFAVTICFIAMGASAKPLESIEKGTWFEVPDSKLSMVAPSTNEYPFLKAAPGVRGMMRAYGGGTSDISRNRLLIWSRGHRDYPGNEIYAFAIDCLCWQRLTEPSLPSSNDDQRGYTEDGAPVARRTYNNIVYLPQPFDALWAQGGVVGRSGVNDRLTWMYSFATNRWERLADVAASANYNYVTFDPATNLVWHDANSRLQSYNPANNTWSDHGKHAGLWARRSAAIDPKRGRLVILGRGAVLAYDLRKPRPTQEVLSTKGANEITKAVSPGFIYHPRIDRFVAWGGGADVYSLELDSLTWRRHPPSPKNVAQPPQKVEYGTFGRFQYFPSRDLFVLAHRVAQNVFLYRLDAQSGVAENTPQTGVRIERTGKWYEKPSLAARDARDGDVLEIRAGLYTGDVAVWKQNGLTLRGEGGRAHLRADGNSAAGKGIWVIAGNDTTIERIEFSGAKVSDGNGAGIRLEGRNLTIRDSYFHHNENGILGGHPDGIIVIENSDFAHNGAGGGKTHNIYIGKAARLEIRNSKIHHAIVGHNIKSRARETVIERNMIMDGPDGRSSYAIDLPNGGIVRISENVIQQGPQTENLTLISYGAEGIKHEENELRIVENVLIDQSGRGKFLKAIGTQPILRDNVMSKGSDR